ncbi:hypothetical protein [Flavobacterium capsici]|uniref:Uncharacterized protein n=1 Tax=Flavobacterium capsici TaxID=3075618 RepID=A0AA96EZ26_9FLAO|nr:MULTISPECIES: hypothetical protein [unclassified Flavobacterium]WNM19497.1 hypothetical protein RN608_02160 [Flavobacterium sp. PMR2A8]WNM20886.1 hypothetical protein RN605_09330 [Flavobacterium sp. PMTSA4]
MQKANYIVNFLDKAISNKSITSIQINLYVALWYAWINNNQINPISISREDLMKISKIHSTATYHKSMKLLHENGFITYVPSFNPYKSSQVFLNKLL